MFVTDGVFGPPHVAVDGVGNILLVWEQGVAPRNFYGAQSVWAKRFIPGSGWGPSETLYDLGKPMLFCALNPRVAALPSGNAIVAWSSCSAEVWVDAFDPLSGWRQPFRLASAGRSPAVAANGVDGGFVVFTNSFTYASRWSLKDGFSSPELVLQGAELAFAAGLAGNAFVATVVNPYPQPAAVAVARFDTNRGWLPPVVLRADEQAGDVYLSALAADATGNALVLWDLAGVDNYAALYAASFRPSVGWGSPRRIDATSFSSSLNSETTAAWNDSAEAAVVWPQHSPSRLWASRLDSSGVGGTPQALQTAASVWCPAVESDGSSGFVAAWRQFELNDKFHSMWAARFSPQQGWGVPALLTSARSVGCPVLAATPDGQPLLFWAQSEEEPSPAGFSGSQVYMSRLVDE